MKSQELYSFLKKIFSVFFVVVMMFSVEAFAKKAAFLTSTIVPAARGFAKITKDQNKNYIIKIHIANLAESKRLQPSKRTYVVWMVTDGDKTENIGQLNSSSALLSKKLKASLETRSSSRPVKIFITAEDEGNTQTPGTQMILSTDKFWR